MPAARGVKRTSSKLSAATSSTAPKNKKKRGAIQLEIPEAPKRRGRVLVCGQGDVGQLGLGEGVEETSRFKYVSALGNKIVDVRAGGMHTIALDSDGKVWTFGCNDEGALGRATSGEQDEGTPRATSLPARAVAIAAGDSHSAALLETGDVYAWGAFRDSHGSMGLVVRGREGKACKEPVQVHIGETAVGIASGGDHLVILSDSHGSMGLVVRGREGKACKEPVQVHIGETAVGIASGGDHLVILSSSGSVYTMGCGEQGQLGRLAQRSASRDARQGFSALLVPMKVTLKGGARRVWAGYHATFALDANDKVFAWGLNNYGQLGITGEKRKVALYSPTECDAFSCVQAGWSAVACGQHHSLALDAAGQVYAVGRQEYGRLGLGDREGDAEALEPIPKLQNKKCISIAAGTCNSFAVADSGEVFAWGMGSEGQLGTGNCNDAAEPALAPLAAPAAPLRVCAGGQHTVLLLAPIGSYNCNDAAEPALAPLAAPAAPLRVCAGGQHTVLLLEEPQSQKEESPAPEEETSEQKADAVTEEDEEEKEPEVERRKPRGGKRPKKQQQEDEVSSTSAPAEPEPQKVNGDETKDTAMDVDETDKPQEEEKEDMNTEESEPEKPAQDIEMKEESKPETTDTSSQGTTDSDAKSQETEPSEPTEATNLNGDSAETKTEPIPTNTPLTTTA